MDDETLRALAAKRGVVQIVAFDGYLKKQPEERAAATRELRQSVGLAANAQPTSLAPEQRAAYDCVLETQKAIIAAIKPKHFSSES